MKGSYNLVQLAGSFVLMIACGSPSNGQSAPVPLIGPAASAVGCFIQTDFVAGGKHNFELVALGGSKKSMSRA